jgi:hypothetical protein
MEEVLKSKHDQKHEREEGFFFFVVTLGVFASFLTSFRTKKDKI